jgi:signal transduction histidine kinase/ActR/RegA family two-component response regulator
MRNIIDREILRNWLSAIIILSILRAIMLYLFNRRSPAAERLHVWKWLNIAGLAASGIIWGSSVIFLFPQESTEHIFFLAAVLSSMVAGAAMAFSIIMIAFLSYSIPCLLPLIVRLLMMPGELPLTMAVLAVVYLTFSIFIATNIRRTRMELLYLQEDLAQRVVHRTADLQEANRRLKDEINERALAEQQRQRLSEQLEQARKFEAVATLAGGIAHQFNNALAVIVGNIELLRFITPSIPELQERIAPVMASAIQMTQLTDQLLAYAKGGKYKAQWVDAETFFRGSLESARRGLRPEIDFSISIEPNLPQIQIDVTQMQMAITAVVANAIEAIRERGRIDVECRRLPDDASPQTRGDASWVVVSIRDSGVGMTPDTLARVFDPFFSTKFQGRGLAMAAVYGIVQNHSGKIEVISAPEQGTMVTIQLPAESAAPVAASKPPDEPELHRGSGSVLLVEDEKMVCEVNRAILEHLGYHVVEAATGAEALALIDDRAFDIVLLDMKLPDIEGKTVFTQIKQRRPDSRVIVCSGYTLEGSAQGLLGSGADAFIQKPFSLSLISSKLNEVLAKKRA